MFTPTKGENIRKGREKALEFCNNETKRIEADHQKPPKILAQHGAFDADLQEAFSMLAFVCGLDTEKEVHAFQLGLRFQFYRKYSFFWYDFAKYLVEEMIRKIKDYQTEWKFRFPSFLSHMFLHQNPNFFDRHVKLAIFDERRRRKSVSV